MKNGTERTFYPDGKREGEITYVNGQVNGITKHWHPNGVLASEIPVKNNIVEGVAKFWDENGNLLGTYEIRNGTGVQKMWFPNGTLMGKTPLLNGMISGRQIAYFEDGTLAGETYFIRNQQVSKRKYRDACQKDPSLPRYEDEARLKPTTRTRPKPDKSPTKEGAEDSFLPEQLLAEAGGREVLEWLQEGAAARTLGELPTREGSIALAKEIYALGATNVTTVSIHRYPNGEENSGKLILSLPNQKTVRKKLFAWAAEWAQEQGYDPELDTGQKHLFVMLD